MGPSMAFLRMQVRLAATSAGVILWDGPFLDVRSPQALADDCAQAASAGLDGKLCIHPVQVQVVNAAFSPTEEDRLRAAAILAAAKIHGEGAFLQDGKMVDAPVISWAKSTLRQTL